MSLWAVVLGVLILWGLAAWVWNMATTHIPWRGDEYAPTRHGRLHALMQLGRHRSP